MARSWLIPNGEARVSGTYADDFADGIVDQTGTVSHVPLLGGKTETGTIIVTIRGGYGHDRAGHRLPEPLHPASRIM